MSLAFLFHYLLLENVSDVLTSETCWALNNEIIKQVTSSWSLFIQLSSLQLFMREIQSDRPNKRWWSPIVIKI